MNSYGRFESTNYYCTPVLTRIYSVVSSNTLILISTALGISNIGGVEGLPGCDDGTFVPVHQTTRRHAPSTVLFEITYRHKTVRHAAYSVCSYRPLLSADTLPSYGYKALCPCTTSENLGI